jgi:hypothetical protein
MRQAITALVAAALLSAPAAAEQQRWVQTLETMHARLIEVGTWQFSATKLGPDGKPECYESWTFNADGTGLIVSGEQRVTTRWETEELKDLGYYVFIASETSTPGPDCMGRAVDLSRYPRKASGYQLFFFDNGTFALVCTAGKVIRLPDGTTSSLLDADDCWGDLKPLAKG